MFNKKNNGVKGTETKPLAVCPNCKCELEFQFTHNHTTTTTTELVKIAKKK